MGEMRVMDQSGDEKIEWDPADKESTDKAKSKFDDLKKKGYDFYEVADAKGKAVKKFSKKLGKLIAAPGVAKTASQKTGGRAMAGGPNDSLGLGRLPDGWLDAAQRLG